MLNHTVTQRLYAGLLCGCWVGVESDGCLDFGFCPEHRERAGDGACHASAMTFADLARRPVPPPAPTDQGIYESVMSALQPAEEAGGPAGRRYLELMERIAAQCLERCQAYQEILAEEERLAR